MKVCIVENCNSKLEAKGYCKKHYAQFMRKGEITERTRYDKNNIILKEDCAYIELNSMSGEIIGFAKIDLEDVERIQQWHWSYVGKYVKSRTEGVKGWINLHRLLIDAPDDSLVDHKNGDTLDNRKSNLRLCNKSQNAMNTGIRSTNTSGCTGVQKRYNR